MTTRNHRQIKALRESIDISQEMIMLLDDNEVRCEECSELAAEVAEQEESLRKAEQILTLIREAWQECGQEGTQPKVTLYAESLSVLHPDDDDRTLEDDIIEILGVK